MILLIKEKPNRNAYRMACFFKPDENLKQELRKRYWLKVPGADVRNHREILPIAPVGRTLPTPETEKPAEQVHKQPMDAAAEVLPLELLLEVGWFNNISYRNFMLLGKGWERRKVIHGYGYKRVTSHLKTDNININDR